jgi:hypothetical protein
MATTMVAHSMILTESSWCNFNLSFEQHKNNYANLQSSRYTANKVQDSYACGEVVMHLLWECLYDRISKAL